LKGKKKHMKRREKGMRDYSENLLRFKRVMMRWSVYEHEKREKRGREEITILVMESSEDAAVVRDDDDDDDSDDDTVAVWFGFEVDEGVDDREKEN
jgi:hypothetical protein